MTTENIELELEDLKTQIHNTLSEWDNDDSTLATLEKAMNFFCSNWDIAEGYKHAIDDKQELAKSYNFLYHFIISQTKK